MSDDENNIFFVKTLEIFLGKSQLCDISLMSVALDKSVFDGDTILLKMSEEIEKHRYVYVGGGVICSFLTSDNIYKNISNLGNNLTPYSIAVGHENF